MKRIISILAITVLLAGTWGCTDWLEIKPEGEVVLEDFWQNESHVNQILAACYRSLTEYDVMARMLVWGELRSDNVTSGSNMSDDMSKLMTFDISPANPFCQWGAFYSVINYCNNFLYYAPGVVELDANFTNSKLHALEAEVLTIRALAYFYLVRTFEEVPWVDMPSIDDAQDYNVAKSPESVVLDNIVEDLLVALNFARDKHETNVYTKGRITKNAVRALLADIYLWRQEYDKCVEMCDQLLNNPGSLQLVKGEDVLSGVFYRGNSSESIFELQYDDDDQFNWVVREYFGHSDNRLGFWAFPTIYLNESSPNSLFARGSGKLESKNDLRKKDFLRGVADRYFVFKYAGALRLEDAQGFSFYSYRSTTANWIVYRLSDVMLMKAEALIQLGSDNQEALRMINTTYLRSNIEAGTDSLKLSNYGTSGDLESLLLRERQRELMFEGKRWFDLMRLARRQNSPNPLLSYVTRKGAGNIQTSKLTTMDAMYLPIHSDELKANNALVQNPFYQITGESSITQ